MIPQEKGAGLSLELYQAGKNQQAREAQDPAADLLNAQERCVILIPLHLATSTRGARVPSCDLIS